MGVSTSLGTQPSLAKYAKIQPAVAIKPKPQAALKSTFNPRYNPPLLDEQNINTLRKWVLPPRPRPGRKPTGPVLEERTTKKKLKGHEKAVATPLRRTESAPAPAPSDVLELQLAYLARLKEQELMRNYIEVLTDQIKELRFVQSGVITFDALNSGQAPTAAASLPAEQLDHINNIRDLDAFLAHVTTQLNVIHSVTKRFDGGLQLQIRHYLELRAKHHRPAEPTQAAPPVAAASSFTPSLLRPLQMNLFEEEVIDVDVLDELPAEPAEMPRRKGCGFCSGDTPCLCFDAESVFGEK